MIGIGFRPLGKRAHDALLRSDVVLANNRLLDVFRNYVEYENVSERILIHKTVYEMLDYVADNYISKRLSILAAGDPMFFGIGRLVVERLGGETVDVYPDLSSLQVAFSRIKETSNNALLISLHGGPEPEKRRRLEYELRDLPELIKRHEKIGILTDRENNPGIIAKTIKSQLPNFISEIKIYVCEKLGYHDEKIIRGTPDEISEISFEQPNVMIIITDTSGISTIKSRIPSFGLREDEIIHSKGLITKDEVRAVTLHKLRLPDTGVLWDIGSGSGSVSIEAARICPGLKIYALEKEKERTDVIRENVRCMGISNIEIISGCAPATLGDMPAPDRIFIGGSDGRMREIIDVVGSTVSAGIVVVNAVTIETLNEAVECLEEQGFTVSITEVSVSRSKEIAGKRQMSALNPVFIVNGEKR